ncbi:hypothetical protein ONZ45_g3439 [Pleurotus djamor]|nr:hypothetical protein ONZ45_g3439 [Pleurotus djamor]
MIIDEKSMLQEPPPYVPQSRPSNDSVILNANRPPRPAVHTSPFPHHQIRLGRPALDALPAHILLQIVYMTFPQTPGVDEGRLERQRKTLYWLSMCLRLVNRSFFIACMHVLRSTYLPAYDSLIRAPYTSDPFPLPSASSPGHAPSYSSSMSQPEGIQTIQRETAVLDLFIAVKVREDVWMDDSELHLEREEMFKDIFDLLQPRSRLEDLIRAYGTREGVISVAQPGSHISTPTPTRMSAGFNLRGASKRSPPSIPFSAITASFSTRKAGVVMTASGRIKRTIVEVPRSRNERLEVAAKRLVSELVAWVQAGGSV